MPKERAAFPAEMPGKPKNAGYKADDLLARVTRGPNFRCRRLNPYISPGCQQFAGVLLFWVFAWLPFMMVVLHYLGLDLRPYISFVWNMATAASVSVFGAEEQSPDEVGEF